MCDIGKPGEMRTARRRATASARQVTDESVTTRSDDLREPVGVAAEAVEPAPRADQRPQQLVDVRLRGHEVARRRGVLVSHPDRHAGRCAAERVLVGRVVADVQRAGRS